MSLAVARVKQAVPGATPGEVLHGDTSLARDLGTTRRAVATGTAKIESVGLSRWGLFEGPGRNKNVRIPGRAGRQLRALVPPDIAGIPEDDADSAHCGQGLRVAWTRGSTCRQP